MQPKTLFDIEIVVSWEIILALFLKKPKKLLPSCTFQVCSVYLRNILATEVRERIYDIDISDFGRKFKNLDIKGFKSDGDIKTGPQLSVDSANNFSGRGLHETRIEPSIPARVIDCKTAVFLRTRTTVNIRMKGLERV